MGSAAQLYTQGLAAYKATSFETAVQLFSDAIALGTRSAKLYDARASAYEKLSRLQEGLMDAKEVIKLMPASSKGYLRAARMLRLAGKCANGEKVLLQGLSRVPESDEKGQEDLNKELEALREYKAKLEHSPFSSLPLEIFLDIITLATAPSPVEIYGNSQMPRTKPPRPNTLFSAMRVCRTWYHLIKSTPRLWDTLCLDGVINQKNAERKASFFLSLACGMEVKPDVDGKAQRRAEKERARLLDGGTSGRQYGSSKGLRRLVLTAAQDFPAPTYSALLALLASTTAASSLREVVLSFVDGSQSTVSAEAESTRATQLLVFLHQHTRDRLTSLSLCTAGRSYPDFDLTTVFVEFPRLSEFRLVGSTTSNFIFNLRAPFLRHAPAALSDPGSSPADADADATPAFPPTLAKHLTVLGAVLVTESVLSLSSFPHLETLELDTLKSSTVWPLLSAPNLKKYHAVVYGEASAVELQLPDLEKAWAKVEDLRIGGAKRLAPRLLDHACALGPLHFAHLTTLDLSFAALSSSHLATLFCTSNAPLLADLNLSSTTVSPPSRALVLPDRLDALKSLNVSHTLWTTDETVRGLIGAAPRLGRLEVRGNAFITGRPLMELVKARMPVVDPAVGDVPPALSSSSTTAATKKGKEREKPSAPPPPPTYSLLSALALEGCTKIETAAVEWLKRNIRPGGVRFQFVDPAERRKGGGGRWEWGVWVE
ncbi:hypothetical protein JCM8097_002461 [Rhodosporidiobolus ruineniae]